MKHPRPPAKRFARIAAALASLTLLSTFATATPARAVVGACGLSETAFTVSGESCVNTSIIEKGRLLTKQDMLDNMHIYEPWGFSREWLEEASLITLTVAPGMGWSGCSSNGDDGLCDDSGELIKSSLMTSLFPVGMEFQAYGTPEKWIALMCGNFHPVNADLEKTEFRVLESPARTNVNTDTNITVRVTLENKGPLQSADAVDTIGTEVPEDCSVTPQQAVIEATLTVGVPQTFDRVFTVNCSHHSSHEFVFTDQLRSGPRNLDPVMDIKNDPEPIKAVIVVWDSSDLAVTETALVCDPTTEIDTQFSCVGSATVTNAGPYGPTDSSIDLALTGQDDCTATATDDGSPFLRPIAVNGSVDVQREWDVTCTDRSYHDFTLAAEVLSVQDHAEDRNPDNNTGTAEDRTEVFEDVDLEVAVSNLTCTEREFNGTSTSCTATLELTNNGPADDVKTETDVTWDVAEGCTASPTTLTRELDEGSTQSVEVTVEISCPTAARHAVGVQAVLHNAPSDPHAVDSDTAVSLWVPADIKPRSLPSSINVDKQGLTPFALLGTDTFDPTSVNTSSLLFGVTGAEDSNVVCHSALEDVNDDGRPDLVCSATTQLTGVACTTTVMYVTGTLQDGTPLFSEDTVNVVGCKA